MEQRKRGAYKAIGRQQDESLPVAYAADPVLLESASPGAVVDALMASSKDAYFRDNLDDQLAVFDYDTETLQLNYKSDVVNGILWGIVAPGIFLSLLVNETLSMLLLFLSVILVITLIKSLRASPRATKESPHTAVTRTGLLHVQPSISVVAR